MKTNILSKQADRTTSIAAVTTLNGRQGSLSPERIRMEEWLEAATRPHTTKEIAEAVGITDVQARHFLSKLVHQGVLRNVADTKNVRSQYILAEKIRKAEPTPPPQRSLMNRPVHSWSFATPVRPGATDHEAIPSRRGECRVPHMPMMLMASKVKGGVSA
jgi:hypothetical protein